MGWFDEQIRERMRRDQEVMEDSFVRLAGSVLGSQAAEKLQDERLVTKEALDEIRRLAASPKRGKARFVYNKDFLDALDYNRIVSRALGADESILNEWSDLYEEKGNSK